MVADIIFIIYIVFMVGYVYLCYGKYGWNYWMSRRNKDGAAAEILRI